MGDFACFCRLLGDIQLDFQVRIITIKRLREYARLHPSVAPTLDHWEELISRSRFETLVGLRKVLPSADQVEVGSGKTVTIFNIKNHYRLVTAIHYNHQIVYILLLLTHSVKRSVAYRILKGERGLTTAHIKALRERFGVSADVFV